MIRKRLFHVIWMLLWPARIYVTGSPFRIGKNFLREVLMRPLLPPTSYTFLAPLPFGRRIELRYREIIGLSTLLEGPFERAEIATVCSYACRDSTAIDVGANIGIYTVVLATAVGAQGTVLAFEPSPENVERLRRNLRINDIANVNVFPLAVGDTNESAVLHLSDDPAFHSTAIVAEGRAAGRWMTVAASTLDQTWSQSRRPAVSVLKIDVEGTELRVLQGARELLDACRPTLLVEIKSPHQLVQIERFLKKYDYRSEQRKGFMPWNYLFVAERSNEPR